VDVNIIADEFFTNNAEIENLSEFLVNKCITAFVHTDQLLAHILPSKDGLSLFFETHVVCDHA
jgi:hypothetical protein